MASWTMFMFFALAIPSVNGDDNTDVVQVTLQQTVEKGLAKVAERFQATKMENWQELANQVVSEVETNVNGHPHHHAKPKHHHHSNHAQKKTHFSKAELEAGREFLKTNQSSLYLEAKKAFHGYMSAATSLVAGKNRTAANITDDMLRAYKAPWCEALEGAYGRPICEDQNGYQLSKAWFHTKCLLEACVDSGCLGEKGGTRFMILTEIFDSLQKQMPDVNLHLQAAEEIDWEQPEFCPGEEDVFLLKVKQHQNKMLARHKKVQQAMAHTKAVAEGLLASSKNLAEDSIQSVWEDICGHLKCDHGSWVEIMDAMHGHAVDLSEEGMPTRMLIEHITSVRKTHDVLLEAFHKFTLPEMENIEKGKSTASPHVASLYQMMSKESIGEAGTARYQALGKELLAVADAAYALKHGSTVHLTWFSWCWKAIANSQLCYEFPPIPLGGVFKLSMGFVIQCGGGVDMPKVFNAIFNGASASGVAGFKCTFRAAIGIGAGVGDVRYGGTAGLAIATVLDIQIHISSSPHLAITAGIVVAAAAAWKASGSSCFLGGSFSGWTCAFKLAVGVGVVCMDFGLVPNQEADCNPDDHL